MNQRTKFIIAIISGLVGVAVLVAFASLLAFYYRKKKQAPTTCDLEVTFPNFSYKNLLKATNGFSYENLIGSGTFGVVYGGTLGEEQMTVAIKKFKLEHKGAYKSFMVECGALQNVRHRNVVKVITACSGIDYQGNDFKALVYEYVINGSLEDWLHPDRQVINMEGNNHEPRTLNLFQRLDIAVDIAFALEYLHDHCGASIIHCDLKPSNVLLNSEMIAHVGDFGLAKFLSNGIASSHGNQSSSIGVGGSVGYAPPEYGLGNELSTHGDVYSFGILTLEMFTGMRPTNDMFKDGPSLHHFVKVVLPDQVFEILDHNLLKDIVGDQEDTTVRPLNFRRADQKSKTMEALISVLEIALS